MRNKIKYGLKMVAYLKKLEKYNYFKFKFIKQMKIRGPILNNGIVPRNKFFLSFGWKLHFRDAL